MDVTLARTFLAAAETGSFLAAAQRVHSSPSAVTERIKQLEHLLGAKLFERDRRGCRLTWAGERFVDPAQAVISAWELGRSLVRLPAQFTRSLKIGGQHALWPELMIPVLQELADTRADIAIHASAGSPHQLNRALSDGTLDMACLYNPIRRDDIQFEALADDELVLVSSISDRHWTDCFVHFDWGSHANGEIRARVGDLPQSSIELDLGVLCLEWLTQVGGAGFVPRRMARRHLADGRLKWIEPTMRVHFPPFICWRKALDAGTAEAVLKLARCHAGLGQMG